MFCLHDEPGVHRVWLPDVESPGLAMSRAFGDYCIKDYGLISVPEVTQRNISSKDQFVVLASDGVSILSYKLVTMIEIVCNILLVKFFSHKTNLTSYIYLISYRKKLNNYRSYYSRVVGLVLVQLEPNQPLN